MAAIKSPEHKRAKGAQQGSTPDATMIPDRESSPRRMVALNNMELTQAFLAHEEQLATLQTQVAIVFKLPADAVLAKSLISAVQGWQKVTALDGHTRKGPAIRQYVPRCCMS